MTLPNRHLPGQTAHLTRRTTQRQFLLKNKKGSRTKNDLGYVFALACKRHNQSPHALTMMDNHHHTCLTDNNGNRSDCIRDFHHLTTKVMNKKLKRRESLWSSSAPGNTVLLDTETVVKTLLYIWLNPVEAGLVSTVDQWQHLQILPKHWGKPMRFKRCDFFQAEGENEKFPEVIEITPMPPAMFDHLPRDEVVAYFEMRIKEEEKRIRNERKKAGKAKVMGMKKCRAQSPFETPKTSVPMYSRNPRFASTIVENVKLAIAAMKSFWRQYKKRLEKFRDGSKAMFPSGTILMRKVFGVKCLELGNLDPHCPTYAPFEI